jgi:DNA polymerase type B, organellar and viral
MSLGEFIVFVIGKGIRDHGIIDVPSNIMLVGHYNRADLPAFREKEDLLWKLTNIRKSFITLGIPLSIRILFSNKEKDFVELKTYVRDTILLAPEGKKSLAEVGKLVGFEKIKLADNPADELTFKKNMKIVRDNKWDLFRDYALLDAEICVQYFKFLTKLYRDLTGVKLLPSTLSSIGIDLLIDGWKSRLPPVNVDEIVGKESSTETIWNDRTAQFNTKRKIVYIEELSWFVDFATECYHGGRGEQLWFGPSFEDDWSDYDLTGAYPTAMATIGKPDWKKIRPTQSLDELKTEAFGFACVDFEFPDNIRYPTLPVRTENGIVFPLSGRSYCASPEIDVARQLGCRLTLKFGLIIPQDAKQRVFFNFIKQSIANRTSSETPIENAFWKEITNSSYGKTAQGLREKRVFNLKEKKSEKIAESQISNPFYAAYITSFVRAVVGEIINKIPEDKMVFSVTTDGFLTNATVKEMEVAKMGKVARLFGQARFDLTGKREVLSEKHAVRQILGWRTRGQATIKPGTSDRTKTIVLAKAGIRPPHYAYEVDEQNDYILKTFFERQFGSQITLDVFTSVREMILYDADLVSKQSVKKMSMEYDFKRQPYSVAMTHVRNPHDPRNRYHHIAFSTRPWRTIEEFKTVRSFWIDFYRRNKQCIKTIDDFRQFAELFDMVNSLSGKKAKYLKRGPNPDLKRLQMDLCRAFKQGHAGLSDSNMTANEFAAELNERGLASRGVITRRADVENGKKSKFLPNCTPATANVRTVIENLQASFPKLDPDQILAPLDHQFGLTAALSNSCLFTRKLAAKRSNKP